jgi:hypothetical protein
MAKGEWKPKYSKEIEYSEFKTDYGTHHMMHIPLNVNDETGFGKLKGYGLSQLRALTKPETLMAIRKHMAEYPEEGVVQIKADEHEGKEWEDK